MKRGLLFLLMIASVNAQLVVQQMLSESTDVQANRYITVTHQLTNHQDSPITDIVFYEELPPHAEITSCNCDVRTRGTTYTLTVLDLPAGVTRDITYTVRASRGEHTLKLGHKTYTFNNATQERLGNEYTVSVKKSFFEVIIDYWHALF